MARMIGSNLSSNPFSARRFVPGAIPWFGEEPDEVARMFARATEPGACHQVIGEHGTGKSTLLVHLERHALRVGAAAVRFRGSRGVPVRALLALAKLEGPRLVLVDELEELNPVTFALLRGLARVIGATMVVSGHRDHGWPTLAHRRVDDATAARVIAHLAGAEAPAGARAGERLARHRGNMREVLLELYDEAELSGRALVVGNAALAADRGGAWPTEPARSSCSGPPSRPGSRRFVSA